VYIVADREVAHPEKVVTLGKLVQIEQHFLRRLQVAFAPALDRILLPLFGARVVEVLSAPRRHRHVGLLDAAEHFLVERPLQFLLPGGHGLGIGVLRLQVVDDLRVRLLAQPPVMVDHLFAVPRLPVLNPLADRRERGRLRQHDGGERHDD
jgi:hypothetical protein